jgi:hypothetical protein
MHAGGVPRLVQFGFAEIRYAQHLFYILLTVYFDGNLLDIVANAFQYPRVILTPYREASTIVYSLVELCRYVRRKDLVHR